MAGVWHVSGLCPDARLSGEALSLVGESGKHTDFLRLFPVNGPRVWTQ